MTTPTIDQLVAALLAFSNAGGENRDFVSRTIAMKAALEAAFATGEGKPMTKCEARQYSDQMQCGRCGLAWDVNDQDPPKCATAIDRRAIPDRRHTKSASKEPLRTDKNERRFLACVSTLVPVDLFDAQALEMAELYEKQRATGVSGIEAMRAVYRVFLDKLP